MTHRFLLEPGSWSCNGYWLEKNQTPSQLQGITAVTWKQDNWFTIISRLFVGSSQSEIALKYKGRLDADGKSYTYVLQHSLWGRVEGEGWIGPHAIVQNYWLVGATERHTGFDTFLCLNEQTYHLSSGLLAGYQLKNTIEITLKRQT